MFWEKTTEVVDVKEDALNEGESTGISVEAVEDAKVGEKQTTVETILRAADHVSPLHVSRMPQSIGITLLLMLGLAYSISFLYLLVDLFASTFNFLVDPYLNSLFTPSVIFLHVFCRLLGG